jgi:hypothetical protein
LEICWRTPNGRKGFFGHSPVAGAALMSLRTIIVALNAQRLRRQDLRANEGQTTTWNEAVNYVSCIKARDEANPRSGQGGDFLPKSISDAAFPAG